MSHLSELTDEELARRVQDGNARMFGVLVERYADKLSRYGRKFLFKEDDVEDLVQDVFIKAYVNIRGFDPSRRFSPWIYRIAHNEFINAMRKRGREPVSFIDLDTLLPHPAAKEATDAGAQRQDMRRLLDRALDRIGPKYREPLVLFYFEDLDYREIADVLRIPVSTVGVRLTRGRALLKRLVPPDSL